MIYKRLTTESLTIKNLFDYLEIADLANAIEDVKFPISVKTPYGFKPIVTAFRTEKQKSVTTYFRNNSTLKTSDQHLLKANGEWKKVRDIVEEDVIETETGTTSILRKHDGKEEILYDISVADVHCYYSNGILSHNSWILAKLGAEAMRQGKNVVHFSMELNENYVGLRYDCCFTHIEFQNIRNNVDVVKEKIKDIKGRLIVKYFPLKTVSAQSLKYHVERIQSLEGIKIDLVIVDYADILRAAEKDKNANSYADMGNIYEELRTVAGELQMPVWTASQTNRCFCVNTSVSVNNKGIIPAKELVVGDEILTHEGYKSVTEIYPIEQKPTYRIKLKSGKHIDCTCEHRFPVKYGVCKSIQTGLSVGDELFTKK